MPDYFFENISANDLAQWSLRPVSYLVIGEIIRDLIYETTQGATDLLSRVRFQGSDDVNTPGFDGYTDLPDGSTSAFPSGPCVWELSMRGDIKAKANEDFKKRTFGESCLPPEEMSNTTYIQLTFHIWPEKEKAAWITEKNALGKWKAVRFYDGADLLPLINRTVASKAHLMASMNKHIPGVSFLDEYWDAYCSKISNYDCPEELYLLERKEAVERLKGKIINEAPRLVKVLNFFAQEEALRFLAAFFRLNKFGMPVLIVDKVEALHTLKNLNFSGIIILNNIDTSQDNIQFIKSMRSINILAVFDSHRGAEESIVVKPVRVHQLEDFFKEKMPSMRLTNAEIEQSYGVIECLRCYLIYKHDGLNSPRRCAVNQGDMLAYFIADSWDGAHECDILFLQGICGKTKEQIASDISKLKGENFPFVRGVGVKVLGLNKIEAWHYSAPAIDEDNIKSIFTHIKGVFKESDPKWSLEADKRFAAEIYDAKAKYSHTLKEGIVRSLLFMFKHAHICSIPDLLKDRISYCIKEIFAGINSWQEWASIDPFLPTLAETAPEEFLDWLEDSALKRRTSLEALFSDEQTSNFLTSGGCKYCGLLWGLERLMWIKDYAVRSMFALADLSALPIGKAYSNSPLDSLSSAFIFWMPQCVLSYQERLSVIKKITQKNPDIGRKLVNKALHALSSAHIQAPAYEIAEPYKDSAEEETAYYKELVALLLLSAKSDPKALLEIYKKSGNDLHTKYKILQLLEPFEWDRELALKLWERLRTDLYYAKRRAEKRIESLPKEYVKTLEAAYEKFTPADEADKIAWVFKCMPKFPYEVSPKKYRDERPEVGVRIEMLEEYLDAEGLDALPKLLGKIEFMHEIAEAACKGSFCMRIDSLMASYSMSSDESLKKFAKNYLANIYYHRRKDFISLYEKAGFEERKRFLCSLPYDDFVRDALVQSEEYNTFYWQNCYGSVDENTPYSDEYIDGFISADRIEKALNGIYFLKKKVKTSTLFQLLSKCTQEKFHKISAHESHEILGLFEEIYRRAENGEIIDGVLCANLERVFLVFFDHLYTDLHPRYLYMILLDNPSVYMEIVRIVYLNDKKEAAERTEGSNAMPPEIAYRILESLRTVPGLDASTDKFDSDTYKKWVCVVLKLAAEQGYIIGAKISLAHTLQFTPAGSDGIWPHEALRDLLEDELKYDFIDTFVMEKMNSRGVTTRSIGEGGKQEHDLASKYNDEAAKLNVEYPHTAKLLSSIAVRYTSHGNYNDSRLD